MPRPKMGDEKHIHILDFAGESKYILKCTCTESPEQYDVTFEGGQVGYLRVRNGGFSADYPDHNGEPVYSAEIAGWGGGFDDENRGRYLSEAVQEIHKRRIAL